MLRLLGLIFAVLAGIVRAQDMQGEGARAAELGELWFEYHKESLIGLQSGLENRISPDAFLAVEPVLYLPAWMVFAGLAAVFWGLALLIRVLRPPRRPEEAEA